jgi:cobalamin-dependent methionine synthase I
MDRRRRDLVETFMAALGGPSVVNDLTQVTVRKAAELVVLAEATRAGMLNGVVTDITALIRIEGEARRACRALGLKIEPVPPKTTPAGLQRARARWDADEKAKAEADEKAKAQAVEEAGEATAKDNTDLPDARVE